MRYYSVQQSLPAFLRPSPLDPRHERRCRTVQCGEKTGSPVRPQRTHEHELATNGARLHAGGAQATSPLVCVPLCLAIRPTRRVANNVTLYLPHIRPFASRSSTVKLLHIFDSPHGRNPRTSPSVFYAAPFRAHRLTAIVRYTAMIPDRHPAL